MSSVQERLQLKRIPLDTWSVREQLCLATAVKRSGDQNWMSVSRSLKTIGDSNRPPDWYSQKSCAAQYGVLLEHVETPKRKKRCTEGTSVVETPQESIVKRLTEERIAEIQKNIAAMMQQYEQLKKEVQEVWDPNTTEQRIEEMWAEVEAAKRAREREAVKRAAWLKEREERRALAERSWRPPPPQTTATAPVAVSPQPTPASPLLTSLLQSSPVVTTPQHISHPANAIDTVSPSVGAPTLSMLLERPKPAPAPPQNDASRAAIEHIKSQLVQIEHELKANTRSPSAVPLAPPAVDIDDIEIKAEDVYAFRDIDIQIPPVTSIHKSTVRSGDPSYFKKDEEIKVTSKCNLEHPGVEPTNIEATVVIDDRRSPVSSDNKSTDKTSKAEETSTLQSDLKNPGDSIKISFPEVKFPTPEIKVITSDDEKIKDESKESEICSVKDKSLKEIDKEVKNCEEVHKDDSATKESETPNPESTESVQDQHSANTPVGSPTVLPSSDTTTVDLPIAVEDIPLPPDPEPEFRPEENTQITDLADIPLPPSPEPVKADDYRDQPIQDVAEAQEQIQEVEDVPIGEEEINKEESKEIPPSTERADEGPPSQSRVQHIKEEKLDAEEAHTETDDDTPMELSREEERGGKKKRDYSRKKKFEMRTYSGSESAPESPSAGDADRQHRLWKKSVMLVYNRLCSHKNASLFLRPITDEEAPGYSIVVKRPMDLNTIKKNIEAGAIRTTGQFQRDVLLMLSNALIYNSSEHSVYRMAMEMHEEAQCQLEMLVAAQAHAGLAPPPPARRKRRRLRSPPSDASAH